MKWTRYIGPILGAVGLLVIFVVAPLVGPFLTPVLGIEDDGSMRAHALLHGDPSLGEILLVWAGAVLLVTGALVVLARVTRRTRKAGTDRSSASST